MKKILLVLSVAFVAMGCGLEEGKKTPSADNDNTADGGIIHVDTIVVDNVVVDHQQVDNEHVDTQNVDEQNVDTSNVDEQNVDTQNVDEQNVDTQNVADAGTPDSGTDAGPTVRCGDGICEGTEDDLNCSNDCVAPAPAFAAAPFKVNGKYAFGFSTDYISGSLCGETRVFYGPMTNAVDLFDRDSVTGAYDGYLSTTMPGLAAGEYRMTYVDDACPGEVLGAQGQAWALYGDMSDIVHMDSTARSFLYCPQYVPAENKCVTVTTPGCEIRFNVSSDGTITGAGNMTNLTSAATGCY